jgi:hypothetical protein
MAEQETITLTDINHVLYSMAVAWVVKMLRGKILCGKVVERKKSF